MGARAGQLQGFAEAAPTDQRSLRVGGRVVERVARRGQIPAEMPARGRLGGRQLEGQAVVVHAGHGAVGCDRDLDHGATRRGQGHRPGKDGR